MERLRFNAGDEDASDPDERVISDDELEEAKRECERAHQAA
jgi:hypothetical protein